MVNKYIKNVSIQILEVINILSEYGRIAAHFCCSGILYQMLNISFHNIYGIGKDSCYIRIVKSIKKNAISAARKI